MKVLHLGKSTPPSKCKETAIMEKSRKWMIGRIVHFYSRFAREPFAAMIINDALVESTRENWYVNSLLVTSPNGTQSVKENVSQGSPNSNGEWWEETFGAHPAIRAFPAT